MYRAYFVPRSQLLFLAATLSFGACLGSVDGSAKETDETDDDPSGGEGGERSSSGGQGGRTGGGKGGASAGGEIGSSGGGVVGSAGGGGGLTGAGGVVPTGGAAGAGGAPGVGGAGGSLSSGEDVPAGWVRAAVAVGYGGNRSLTRDYGLTWTNKTQLAAGGGDDQNLLRGVAFGHGKWVAVGWKHLVSEDGANWTVVQRQNACSLMEDIAYGNGVFLGTCGDNAHTSTDGVTFSQGSRIGSTGGHTYVWFGNGMFIASGDNGASFSSADGKKWTSIPQKRAWFCNNEIRTETECGSAAWADGYFVREKYPMGFQRSMDGKTWQSAGPGRGTYRIRFGYAPPQ